MQDQKGVNVEWGRMVWAYDEILLRNNEGGVRLEVKRLLEELEVAWTRQSSQQAHCKVLKCCKGRKKRLQADPSIHIKLEPIIKQIGVARKGESPTLPNHLQYCLHRGFTDGRASRHVNLCPISMNFQWHRVDSCS